MRIIPKFFYIFIFATSFVFSQKISYEIGVLTGKASLQTDYGIRGDILSETANNTTSLTVAHYMQFSNSNNWNGRRSILDHIVIKSEINFLNSTDLKHHVNFTESNTNNKQEGENKILSAKEILSKMSGNISLVNFGVQIEYYLKDITNFFNQRSSSKLNPFVNFGVNYSLYNNSVSSSLGDWHTNINFLPEKYRIEGAIKEGSGGAFAFNTGIGTRYKLSRKIDIVAQFKWEIYASDAIDGLQADVVENKSNETLTNLQFGLIYHLNFNKNI